MDLLTIFLFIVGLAFLVGGAEVLVKGASRVAVLLGISPLVIGLTVVALGTSSPELAVSIKASLSGQTDIGVGNIVGSNICNFLLILGIAASVTPLFVVQQLVRLDVPILIGVSVLLYILGFDGTLTRIEGLGLFMIGIIYTVFLIYKSRKEGAEVTEEYDGEYGDADSGKSAAGWIKNISFIIAGLVLLTVGSQWLVDGAVAFARVLGLSELVIGLTVVAIGTSLPEVATSVMASLRGERDIAVGNVVGSSLYNILLVLGLTTSLTTGGIVVAASAINFDIPVMIVVTFAALPIFFTGHIIKRWEGALFLAYYACYLAYLLMKSAEHSALPYFGGAMLLFVIPLTFITIIVLAVRALRNGNGESGMA